MKLDAKHVEKVAKKKKMERTRKKKEKETERKRKRRDQCIDTLENPQDQRLKEV